MSTDPSTDQNNDQNTCIAECPFCEKGGLPILPLRYAIARTDIAPYAPYAPKLEASFGEGVTDIPLPPGQDYTLRLLRPGYLYVFNEVRGAWSGYVVTEKGYLYPYVTDLLHRVLVRMNPEQPQDGIDAYLQPPAEIEEFSCAKNADHHYPGRCITIPNADRADNLYLAFSDTAWTKREWYEHATNAVVDSSGVRRRDHMRRISLAAWRGGSAPHAASMTNIPNLVAESAYSWSPHGHVWQSSEEAVGPENATAFNHDVAPINGIDGQVEGLIQWADTQAQPLEMTPLIVELDDPVGVASDIAGLMRRRLREFTHRLEFKRPLTVSALLGSLESAIRSQGELAAIKKAEDEAMAPLTPGYGMRASQGGLDLKAHHQRRLQVDPPYRQRWERETAEAKDTAVAAMTPADLQAAADEAWGKYQQTLEPGQPERWRRDVYLKALQDLDRDHTLPLAQAHIAWLRSDAMVRSFACNHDDRDGESGAGYIQTLLLCIQDTQEITLCFELYQDWLDAARPDERNLLQKALTHNQRVLLDAFAGTDTSTPDIPYDKWTSLIELYGHALAHVNQGETNIVAQLIVAVGGPIMKVLDKALDRGMHRLVMVLGVISGSPIVKVQHLGTVDDTLEVMVRMMKQLNPDVLADIDADLLKRRLEIQSRGTRRRVETLPDSTGRPTQQVTMRVDRFALIDLETEAGASARSARKVARQASNTLLTMNMDEWPRGYQQRLTTRSRNLQEMVDGNAKLAVISLILQGFAIAQMSGKLDEQMAHQGTENTWRLGASWIGIFAGVGGLIDDIVQKGIIAGSTRLAQMARSSWLRITSKASKTLGIIGTAISSFFDFSNAYQETVKGNITASILYLLSGTLGLGAAVVFTSWGASLLGLSAIAATSIGLILITMSIFIGLMIDHFKNNSLQDWIERCFFGIIEEEKYKSLDIELEQLKVAIKNLS